MSLAVFCILSYTAAAFSIVHICIDIHIVQQRKCVRNKRGDFGTARTKKEKDLLPPAEKIRYWVSDNPRITQKDDRSHLKLPPRYRTWFPTGFTSSPTFHILIKSSKKTPIPGFRPPYLPLTPYLLSSFWSPLTSSRKVQERFEHQKVNGAESDI